MNDPDIAAVEDDVRGWLTSMSNWGRWGSEDTLGTLNLLTPAKVAAAVREVRSGQVVSLGRPIGFAPRADPHEAAIPPLHFMQAGGEGARADHAHSAYDWAGLPLHGHYLTHLDAHAHMFWDRQMYNGTSAAAVVADRGALRGGVDGAGGGIVSRGILLDVPAALGVDSLDGAYEITGAELEVAERRAGLTCEPGDVVVVRTGYGATRATGGTSGGLPGLGPSCLPWIKERDIAVLGTDSGTDPSPTRYAERLLAPVHLVCIVAMGMWIIDNLELEELARTCTAASRSSFLFMAAPLRLKNSTGSPLNPLAIL